MAITYTKVNWQNNVTALNAQNLNQMEQGIVDTVSAINALGDLQELKNSAEQVSDLATDIQNLETTVQTYVASDAPEFDSSTGTLRLKK